MSANLSTISELNATAAEIDDTVNDLMTFHPWSKEQLEAGQPVRAAAQQFVRALLLNVPPSADRSAAIRHVREALYNANGALTHSGKY